MRIISSHEIQSMDKVYRLHLINSVTGFKSANLIGSCSKDGVSNLAVISSVTHLSSNPPMVGFFVRPGDQPPDTFENIIDTKHYTINHIPADKIKEAHQTSAKYESKISEFVKTGFTEEYSEEIVAPFVAESSIKLGVKYRNCYSISESETTLVVGEIIEIRVRENFLSEDGYLDLNRAESVSISGLDAYHLPNLIHRFSYARPDKELETID